MNNICLRQQIEKNVLFSKNINKIPFTLLCCNVCKKIEHHEELNRYEELYVFPLLLSYRKENNSFLRSFGSTILEHTAEKFNNADLRQVDEFLSLLSRAADGKDKYSSNDLLALSEGTYCQTIARLYWAGNYDLIRLFAIQYVVNNTKIMGSSARHNWYHKDEDNPFFVIGVSLDEGIVESLTCDIVGNLLNDEQEKLSDAYFFEMKFVDKLREVFKFERKDFFVKFLQSDFLEFLCEATKETEYCDFYNIMALSDQQKWKEVFSILKKYER